MRTYKLNILDKTFVVKVKQFSSESAALEVNGKEYLVNVEEITVDRAETIQTVDTEKVAIPSIGLTNRPKPPVTPHKPSVQANTFEEGVYPVLAPIPGLIMQIYVKTGDVVQEGDPILKMEAMKMENVITATYGGKVIEIKTKPGDTVLQDEVLLIIE